MKNVLAATMSALGLSHPLMGLTKAAPRERFAGQSPEAKQAALDKAEAKRMRRNNKRSRDLFRTKICSPIIRRRLANDLGRSLQNAKIGYDPASGSDHSSTAEVTV